MINLLFFLYMYPVPVPEQQALKTFVISQTITSESVKTRVNLTRTQNKAAPLTSNNLLDDSANARAEYLCKSNTWEHGDWANSFTYDYVKAGENLAHGFLTSQETVDGWVNSPTHFDNMIDTAFTEQGIGIKYCNNYQGRAHSVIVVNHFGTLERIRP